MKRCRGGSGAANPNGFRPHGGTVLRKGAAQIAGAENRYLTAAKKAEIPDPMPHMLLLLAEILRHPAKQHQRTHNQLLGNGGSKSAGGIGQNKFVSVIQPTIHVFVRTGRGKMQPAEPVGALEQSSRKIAHKNFAVG